LICSFIDEQRRRGRRVESVCQVLREQGLAAAGRTYRAWKATRRPADRTVADARVVHRLKALRTDGPDGPGGRAAPEIIYGRRKMTAWLNRTANGTLTQGVRLSQRQVARVMRQESMRGLVRSAKVRTTIPAKDGVARAADLLNRCFSAEAPNTAWVTDFTYVPTWSGFVYVALVIDLYSRAIVGWSAATHKREEFVAEALKMAVWRRQHAGRPRLPGMIHHSDAGSQYTSMKYTETLALENFSASIGTVGDAYDNAAAETVMGLFKNEAIRADSPFRSGPLHGLPDVEKITYEYVDWYNNRRLHGSLDLLTPEEYEQAYYTQEHEPTSR
jgi:transposase InsO family protein